VEELLVKFIKNEKDNKTGEIMPFSNYGKSGAALLMVGSATIPQYCAIGSGSGAAVATLGSLVAEVLSARKIWSSRDISTANQVAFQFDYGASEISGVTLTEFGIGGSIAKGTNDLWNREAMGSVAFDGTSELQIQINYKTF